MIREKWQVAEDDHLCWSDHIEQLPYPDKKLNILVPLSLVIGTFDGDTQIFTCQGDH